MATVETPEGAIIAETIAEMVDMLGYDSGNGTETIRELAEKCAARLRKLREPALEQAGEGKP